MGFQGGVSLATVDFTKQFFPQTQDETLDLKLGHDRRDCLSGSQSNLRFLLVNAESSPRRRCLTCTYLDLDLSNLPYQKHQASMLLVRLGIRDKRLHVS